MLKSMTVWITTNRWKFLKTLPASWETCTHVKKSEKTLESFLDCKQIKPVNPKGNQPWIFIGKIVAEAPIFWPLDGKGGLIGKDPDAGKDRRWNEKGEAEDEMVRYHHQLNGLESEKTTGDSRGQRRLVRRGPLEARTAPRFWDGPSLWMSCLCGPLVPTETFDGN